MRHKLCRLCQTEKPLDQFPAYPDGKVDSRCQVCKQKQCREARRVKMGWNAPLPKAERFWQGVSVGEPDECWEWHGVRNWRGYGRIWWDGRFRQAHRVSLVLAGRDPGGLLVMHQCDNPPCVNPRHLRAGTQSDNIRDMYAKGRGAGGRAKGESSGAAKLTEAQVREIRQRRAAGAYGTQLAKEYGVGSSTIYSICRRGTWRHIAEQESA